MENFEETGRKRRMEQPIGSRWQARFKSCDALCSALCVCVFSIFIMFQPLTFQEKVLWLTKSSDVQTLLDVPALSDEYWCWLPLQKYAFNLFLWFIYTLYFLLMSWLLYLCVGCLGIGAVSRSRERVPDVRLRRCFWEYQIHTIWNTNPVLVPFVTELDLFAKFFDNL